MSHPKDSTLITTAILAVAVAVALALLAGCSSPPKDNFPWGPASQEVGRILNGAGR